MARAAAIQTRFPRPPRGVRLAVSAGIVVLLAIVRLWLFPHQVLPVAFGLPLLAFVWLRDRRYLWATVAAFAAIVLIEFFFILPEATNGSPPVARRILDAILILLDLLFVAMIVHGLIGARLRLERQNAELTAGNQDLEAHDREIAQRNRQLQSQTEQIEQERRRFETVVNSLPIGVAIADAEYRELRLNPAAATLLDVPMSINLGSPDAGRKWMLYKDGRPLPLEQYPLYRAVRLGEQIVGEEMERVFSDGRRIITYTSASPIRDREGGIAGGVCAFVDITAQKDLQRELDFRRREAEEASARKSRFLAAASHDIRTPANAIGLLAELIQRSASEPASAAEIPELAKELHDSAVSLVNLVTNILDLTRFDLGKAEMEESDFSLGRLLENECRPLQPLAREKGLEFTCEPPPSPIVLHADAGKLARVVGNLVGNAIKFTQSGRVNVSAAALDKGRARIEVRDTGVGIAPEDVPRIFDEFSQIGRQNREGNKGAGLGLAICKRFIDALGGEIQVQSEPGRGSTFSIILPASRETPNF